MQGFKCTMALGQFFAMVMEKFSLKSTYSDFFNHYK